MVHNYAEGNSCGMRYMEQLGSAGSAYDSHYRRYDSLSVTQTSMIALLPRRIKPTPSMTGATTVPAERTGQVKHLLAEE